MGLFARLRLKEIRLIFGDSGEHGGTPWFFILVLLALLALIFAVLRNSDSGDYRPKRVTSEAIFRFETDSDP